jgi:magnesium-transporting ATPase (P-type)
METKIIKKGFDWLSLIAIILGIIIFVIVYLKTNNNYYENEIVHLKDSISIRLFINSFWGLGIFLLFGGLYSFLIDRNDKEEFDIVPSFGQFLTLILSIVGFIGFALFIILSYLTQPPN